MPGRGTEPGPRLYPECGKTGGPRRHRREGTRTCAACRAYQRAEMARYRIARIVGGPRLVPAFGVHRRVRALARMGWSQDAVARRLGILPERFKKVMGHAECRRELAEQVAALYRELFDQPGGNSWAKANAERRGWPGPMDWDDPDNPDEVPLCEIERAHREALAVQAALRHNERKRLARRVVAAARTREREPEAVAS